MLAPQRTMFGQLAWFESLSRPKSQALLAFLSTNDGSPIVVVVNTAEQALGHPRVLHSDMLRLLPLVFIDGCRVYLLGLR